MRGEELPSREMFVPLVHPPGEAQVDFGEALVVIAGAEQKAHLLAKGLPHSDDSFVQVFPAETTEAFLESHACAFEYFGAVPSRILYDNTKIAVTRIPGGEERTRTKAFVELQSRYLFADKSGRPAKGNDKGKVEGLVGYARRNLMVPIPRVNNWEQLNAYLAAPGPHRRLSSWTIGRNRRSFARLYCARSSQRLRAGQTCCLRSVLPLLPLPVLPAECEGQCAQSCPKKIKESLLA